ncbi:MAG: hypothetical protein ACOVOQ_12755 [Flavobacterium sp.]
MEKGKLKKQSSYLLCLIISFFIVSCASKINQEYFSNTLGLNISIQKKTFDSSDAINQQGEGFTIEVYTYEDKKNENILKSISSFPVTYDIRKTWKISQWSKTPLSNKDVQNLLFKYAIKDEKMKMQLQKIQEVLNSTDNYFSYYYKDYEGEIYAVDISIIDTKNKIIYQCEVIT